MYICGLDEGEMNLVGEKGLKTLLMAASKKKEMELTQTLKDHQNRGTPVHVHHDCRRRLTDFRKQPVGPEPKRLRASTDAAFAWKTCCFLCSKTIARNKEKFHQVHTLPLHNNIECAKARNDDWGEALLTRLGTSNDFVAEEAVYHSSCMAAFKLNKVGRSVRGRPEYPTMTDVFQHIRDWLEITAESEVYSVRELYDKIIKDSDGVGYCLKTFRSKLKARYKDHLGCKGELVCFKDMADYILRNLKEEGPKTKENVVKAAAKIGKEEIREMNYSKEFYPSVDDIVDGEKWVPESLKNFMELLVPSRQKQLSLSQCIIQAT